LVGFTPGFLGKKDKNKKTIIQLEGGHKIRMQPSKIETQICACTMKNFLVYLKEIRKVINNSWTTHLKNKER
jgi:hypothetical protein